MGLEIERRFLVKGESWKSLVKSTQYLKQGYLNSGMEEWILRVRIVNSKESFFTLKSSINGISNHEFEYQIPIEDGKTLLNLAKNKVSKYRHSIEFGKKLWIVDSFLGNNQNLIIAEIELNSENESITIPSWCKDEITGEKSLSNSELAKTPISIWPLKNRLNKKESEKGARNPLDSFYI